LCGIAMPVAARITPHDYAQVEVALPEGAALSLDAVVTDERDVEQPLRWLVTRPAVLVFTDYTCKTLCGPILSFISDALAKSGLAPDQFELLSIGLDPKDTAADTLEMRNAQLGANSALARQGHFLHASEATVQRLTAALGYRYRYDADDDQFIHPAAAYVLRADGVVSRVLTGVGLSGVDMRLALVEAGQGHIGTLRDRIRLLCSHFDPARGIYDPLVSRLVAATGAVTLLLLAGGIGLLILMGRRRTA
jgi:protein SCO1/2